MPGKEVKDITLKDYLDDLKLLYSSISLNESNIEKSIKTRDALEYIRGLGRSKPEALLSDKLLKPIMNAAGITYFPEGKEHLVGESRW
ncbi:MAG: hypothetical protein ACP5UZ_08980 [Thermoplasmata archaeon]